MRECIATRVGRIISANAHALVDAREGATPITLVEEAIREVDSVIGDVRDELGHVVAGHHVASCHLSSERKLHADLGRKVALAICANRDDLAQAAIARQMDIEDQTPVLEGRIGELGARERVLESYLLALQAKRRELLDERKRHDDAKTRVTTTGRSARKTCSVERRITEVESAFDRAMDDHLSSSMDLDAEVQLAEIDDLARRYRIEERLAAAKADVRE